MAEGETVVNSKMKTIKMLVIGDGAVGKSTLIRRFLDENFDREYNQTVGIDFTKKHITIQTSNSGTMEVLVQLWDVGGQNLGGRMLENYVAGAQAVLFVYDSTNAKSLDDLTDWYDSVQRIYIERQQQLPAMALVANKRDLEHLRAVRMDRHEKWASERSMAAHYVSARTGEGVAIAFHATAASALGVRLSSSSLEANRAVVTAEIQVYHAASTGKPVDTRRELTNKSAACSLL